MKTNSPARTTHRQSAMISRRAALRRLGAGGLAAAFTMGTGCRPAVAAAQDNTPTPIPPILVEWVAAWSSGDAQKIAALYVDDAILDDVASGVTFAGPDEIAAHALELNVGLPDGAYDPMNGFATGDRAVLEFTYTGTYTGQLPGLPVGAGQTVSLRGAAVFELADGKFRREAHYYDAYGFLIQLRAIPAPSAVATPDAG